MGKVGNFFRTAAKNAWQVGKTIGKGVVTGAKTVAKYAPKVIDIAKKVSDMASLVPGQVGMIGRTISGGLDTVKNVIDAIPGGKVKDGLDKMIGGYAGTYEGAMKNASRYADKIAQGGQIANNIIKAF